MPAIPAPQPALKPVVLQPAELAARLLGGDRRALAKSITMVESTRADHNAVAGELLSMVMESTGGAHRVGISGTPGVGKSTFIERLTLDLVEEGHRVAILAVDPTSARTGGSILGDKTRMARITSHPSVFVRPSPAGASLGGVARRTREVLLLCEAGGYDVVLVETVGVGQSEVAVAGMVDTFCLLLAPAGGDDLQGIKRGVMELADLVVINKADGELLGAARHAAADHKLALHMLRPRNTEWTPQVLLTSARTGEGVEEMWGHVQAHREALAATGRLATQRREQAVAWLWTDVKDRLLDLVHSDAELAAEATRVEAEVKAGVLSPTTGAARIVETVGRRA